MSIHNVTKRIDLNVGTYCNLHCSFCYYQNALNDTSPRNNHTTESAKNLISLYKKKGMEALELTGGEPTIRSDIVELVQYAKEKGFKKISVITNGLRLASEEFTRKLIDVGVSDFLFSIHGPTADIHDEVTGVKGSFSKLCKGIENVKKAGVKVRCNSVVTGKNVSNLYYVAHLCFELGVDRFNFIMFNPIEQAKGSIADENIKYSVAAPLLKKAIDDFYRGFEKMIVRYIPLCQMGGYERFVHNIHQVHYDHDEWNYYLRTRVRFPFYKWLAGVFTGYILLPHFLKIGNSISENKHIAILNAHSLMNKIKTTKCRKCRYCFICGGIWKEYYRLYGDKELTGIEGEPIYNITEFLRKDIHGY